MAHKEANPKDVPKERTMSTELSEFITDLRFKVSKDDEHRANWKSKLRIANNQRLGVKRYTTKPYPGAPNIPLPVTDKWIKKAIPSLVLSAWAPKKLCVVKVEEGVVPRPEYVQKAKNAEMALNMIFRKPEMDWFRKMCLAADYTKEKGHAIFRIVEEYKSRVVHKVLNLKAYPAEQLAQLKKLPKAQKEAFLADRYKLDLEDKEDMKVIADILKQFADGEDNIEFDVYEYTSLPNVEIPLPTKITVPNYATDINESPRVVYEYFVTKEEFETKMEDDIWLTKDIENLDMAGTAKKDDDEIEQQKARNEGIASEALETDLFRIHEVLCYYKEKKGEPSKKWVFTFLADVLDPEESLLQDMQFPYEFKGWNYEKHDNEIKDPRYHNSRGLPEQIRAIQDMMEKSVNNMLIRDEMNNTPMWEVLSNSEIMDSHIHFIPGGKMPVKAIGTEIKKMNEPNSVDVSSDRIMQILKAYAEEYVSSSDQLFRNATNAGGGKTLGEIQAGISQNTGPLTIEVINWNNSLSKVYRKVFDMLAERLEESIYIDGIAVTREDFNFPAEVKSNGNLEVSDERFSTQKAYARVNTVANLMKAQVANQEDLYNAASDWMEKDGVKDPDQFLTHPAEILQTQIGQMTQQAQQLSQQIQQMQEILGEGQKDVTKIKARGKKTIKELEGKAEVANEPPADIPKKREG